MGQNKSDFQHEPLTDDATCGISAESFCVSKEITALQDKLTGALIGLTRTMNGKPGMAFKNHSRPIN